MAVARGVVLDPPVLVVADPTSALDVAAEQRLVQRLSARRAGRTTILLSTSPAVLDACRRVAFIGEDGVAHSGTHRQLLDSWPAYRAVVEPGALVESAAGAQAHGAV